MTPPVTAPANLPELVRTAFVRARTAGDLTFFSTQAALLSVQGIPFQLRFAPSLARKPKGPPKPATANAAPFDPFADPPPGLLVVPQLGPAHRLVLNKFAICPDHSILATTAFKPQTHLLDASDLAAAYACIEAYAGSASGSGSGSESASDDHSNDLYVFYNSGAHSGASQPHRHLQLLPVSRMKEGLEENEETTWSVLVDRPAEDLADKLPSFVAAASLNDGQTTHTTPEGLHSLYLSLYRRACAAAGAAEVTDDEAEGNVPAHISYNLALTRHTMAICPRTAEGAPLAADNGTSSSDKGSLSLNGTVLAGTALVKNEAEWDALRADPDLLRQVLAQIGKPPSQKTAAVL